MNSSPTRAAVRITLFYILFAGLWISSSDWLLSLLVSDSHVMAQIAVAKGWVFIFVTATYLFTMMKRELGLRQKAEDETLRRGELLRAVIEGTSDAVYVKDLQNHYLMINPAGAKIMGYPVEEILGKTDSEIFPLASAQRILEYDRRVLDTGQTITFEEAIQIGEAERFFSTTKGVYRDPQGNVIGVIGIARDITDQKRAQEEVQKLNSRLEQRVEERTYQLKAAIDELESFSYSISHDLRAPLRHIDGFSQSLADEYASSFDEEGQMLVRKIRSNVARMNELIDALLSFAHLSRTELVRKPVDLTPIAQSVFDALQKQENWRRVKLTLPEQIQVIGDPYLLRIVVDHLIRNAWKFTYKTELASIELGMDGVQENQNVYFIRDNGIGFDMNYANKLFDAFQTLHSPKEYPGTGIGLAVVKRIIQRHGGKVWAQSAPGQGAAFYFTL
jgi:PAS domain S-box-containing protein